MRTPDNPLLLIYIGTSPIPDVALNYVIAGPGQFAPDRFVRMAAEHVQVALVHEA
jgi:hypothetical protein